MATKQRILWKLVSTAAVAAVLLWPLSDIQAQSRAPKYEFDPTWPKPFPADWTFGGLGGVCVDAQDHVFVLHRRDLPEADLKGGRLAPSVIEIDPSGSVINTWGDPDVIDLRLHSCHFDKDQNVWIASAPSGMVQKFSHDGRRLLRQIGSKGIFDSSDGTPKGRPLNSAAARFFSPSSLYEDPLNGDVYVSDGETAGNNRRIAVFDAKGTFLRQWQPEGMQLVHCMSISNDGLVYVCNREGSRIQVYDKMGTFLNNIDVPDLAPRDGSPKGTGGSAVSLDFSRDRAQSLMYLLNQNNSEVEIIDRATGITLGGFGRAGNVPGGFDNPHGIAVDSRGSVYVTENRGRRIQRFTRID